MKKITFKIIAFSFFLLFMSSLIPNLIWYISGNTSRPEEIMPQHILVGAVVMSSIIISIFVLFINKLVIKRIKALNEATKEVMKGNYDIRLTTAKTDELSELINSFNEMTKELYSNEYVNKDFVRNFSHELKTPLSAIKGYADLIKSKDITKEELIEYSSIISQEANRLSSMSKDMLLISQLENQLIIPLIDKFNITEQIRNVIQLTQLSWDQKQLDFELDVIDVSIQSNKELTYQIWTNLISNAIKFTSPKNTIHISLKELDNDIEFIISNISNISHDDIEKMFNLFFVSDVSRTEKSSGVGLFLTNKIITKLKGTIEVEKEEGSIIFKIILPINI